MMQALVEGSMIVGIYLKLFMIYVQIMKMLSLYQKRDCNIVYSLSILLELFSFCFSKLETKAIETQLLKPPTLQLHLLMF